MCLLQYIGSLFKKKEKRAIFPYSEDHEYRTHHEYYKYGKRAHRSKQNVFGIKDLTPLNGVSWFRYYQKSTN